jgi:hypothetical protein
MAGYGPAQAPPPSAVASGRWGAAVAEVMWPTVEGRATPRRASAIEASSAVAFAKLGG